MKQNTIRYIARFVVEAATPLAVGSGNKGLTIDRLVIKDANGLPFIPGTSLAGVVRHELKRVIELDTAVEKTDLKQLFGHQLTPAEIKIKAEEQGIEPEEVVTGQGSRICFSAAHLTDAMEKITFHHPSTLIQSWGRHSKWLWQIGYYKL